MAMPSAHRNALKKLLQSIADRIREDEARLLKCADGEREKLIQELADLYMRHREIKSVLLGDVDDKLLDGK